MVDAGTVAGTQQVYIMALSFLTRHRGALALGALSLAGTGLALGMAPAPAHASVLRDAWRSISEKVIPQPVQDLGDSLAPILDITDPDHPLSSECSTFIGAAGTLAGSYFGQPQAGAMAGGLVGADICAQGKEAQAPSSGGGNPSGPNRMGSAGHRAVQVPNFGTPRYSSSNTYATEVYIPRF